ncbi:hypothetical protein AALP_AAs41122U000300 [Arabis alpina]|uniref:Aminotransferase-like plant mobile domain-containing protein n=1 Tax=Arabis alpina TaxID=50452 RepID=A0A087G2U4_ARAAL|nr:hypothetical protein AALP_AAs41122U000300 [Arabis alpina]
MEALYEPIWRKAGIFEAIQASIYKIPKKPSLVLALVEKWCPETKSFVFPWGEATITLEDVMVLLGFSVLDSSVSAPLASLEMKDALEKLERVRVENWSIIDGCVSPKSWISIFKSKNDDDDGDEKKKKKIEHEAFLTMWLSNYVFPDVWRPLISRRFFPIAVRLARGEKIVLAPAVLDSLYRDLSRIHGFVNSDKRVTIRSLLKLVQVWIWERFSNIRPEAREIGMGEPRIARWSIRKKSCERNDGRLSFDGFEWRPYNKTIRNWSHPKFYVEEGKWMSVDESLDDEFISFARCLRVSKLGGFDFAEDYYPNRVAMQFGLVTYLSDFTRKEAWDDYNKSLYGQKLYVPSHLATTSVTTRYQEWWLKSVSEFWSWEEPTETNRDDDASPKVQAKLKRGVGKIEDCGGSRSRDMPLSELFQELAKRTSEHLRKKRAREDVDAEMAKSGNKTGGDASQSVEKRIRHEEDNNDSGIVQKVASEVNDEEEAGTEEERITVLIPSDGNNSLEPPLVVSKEGIAETVVPPQETKQNCDVNDRCGHQRRKVFPQ